MTRKMAEFISTEQKKAQRWIVCKPMTESASLYIRRASRKIGLKYYPTEGSVEKVLRDTEGRFSVLALSVEHMTGKLVHES